MTAIIFSRGQAHATRIEISDAEFDDLNHSIAVVVELVGAEEIYDALTSSYAELEKDLLCSTVDFCLFHEFDEATVRSHKNNFVRRVSAFLSAARTYVDSVESRFESVAVGSGQLAKQLKSRAYDNHQGYRILECLRNHSQHRGHVTENITFGSSRGEDDNDNPIWIYGTQLVLDIPDLIAQKAFKRPVKLELAGGPDRMDLMPIVREYVQCFSDIHDALRTHVATAERVAIECMSNAVARLRAAHPGNDPKFPAIGRQLADGTVDEIQNLHILTNPYRTFLKDKNRALRNLPRKSFRS